MKIQEVFLWGMKRVLPELLDMPEGKVIDVGAGNCPAPGAEGLDLPRWNADMDPLPYGPETISGIHAYHLLEHVKHPIHLLAEFQRVLRPGGVVNIVVPYYRSQMAFQDLNHQSFWTEDTLRILFSNPHYTPSGYRWVFRIHTVFILGIVERNLALFIQLEKEGGIL